MYNHDNFFVYRCHIWVSFTNINSFKLLVLLSPFIFSKQVVKKKSKSFSLLRSPLGNKKSKDLFTHQEYKGYFYVEFHKTSSLLSFLSTLENLLNDVQFKVVVKGFFCNPVVSKDVSFDLRQL